MNVKEWVTMSSCNPRDLPSVSVVLDRPELLPSSERFGRNAVADAVRQSIGEARARLIRGEQADVDPEAIAVRAAARLSEKRPSLRPVLNATGILLHTGLGRAPLGEEAVAAVANVARGYCNLEFDLDSGARGRRTTGVADLLRRLTGAEAATVVNNNAGATILALRSLALGREVIVSRGQLVEIGGSFRLPEIFEVSGARLVEVGTTNRTRLDDYARAIGPQSAALLRVHPSNFRVVGFTESVGIAALAELGRSRGLKVVDDIGSGALDHGVPPTITDEPTVTASIAAGADLVLCSGDKLLGGPQCGLLFGTREAISRAESDPLMRALRVDKMTLAALGATLNLALDPETAARSIPLWAFLTTPLDSVVARAERLAETFRTELGLAATVVESDAFFGAGSLPTERIPSAAVRVSAPFPAGWPTEGLWAQALRRGDPPVVPRIQGGAVLFDLRAIEESSDTILLEAVRQTTVSLPRASSYSDLDGIREDEAPAESSLPRLLGSSAGASPSQEDSTPAGSRTTAD
jgi:L-seryl-tRNA(Ser) seleniumtransferase